MRDEDKGGEELASEGEWEDDPHQSTRSVQYISTFAYRISMLNLHVYVTKVSHGAGNGFSAADVDMYFDVIAEAAEDDLRAILQDEGLPLPPVRTQSRFEAHDVHAYLCLRLKPWQAFYFTQSAHLNGVEYTVSVCTLANLLLVLD